TNHESGRSNRQDLFRLQSSGAFCQLLIEGGEPHRLSAASQMERVGEIHALLMPIGSYNSALKFSMFGRSA
ncbi:MAG: hypothetical protein MZV65_44350, partial [Chromatiales bacterium]|nr:hypothetical protein [Chromatiales bacterium]